MTITHHTCQQGTPEWHELRRGLLTASEMCRIMTPTNKPADNDKSRAHMYELLAQRITGFVEPHYYSDDMLRGHDDEARAKALYSEKYAPVEDVGFVTREWDWGTLGYSPDGLVGDDGLVESKSRRAKYQIQTALGGAVPAEYVLQVQTGMLMTGRKWCDFLSYSGGLPMVVFRVHADEILQAAILVTAERFEARLQAAQVEFERVVAERAWWPTERSVEAGGEIVL